MRGALQPVVVVALALASNTCSPPLPGQRPEDMDRLALLFASAYIECNPRSAFEIAVEPDDPRDEARLTRNLSAFFRLLLDDDAVRVEPAMYSSCVAFLESSSRCDGVGGEGEGDCDRIFVGTRAGGERCGLREECASEVCLFGDSSACGTCADDRLGQRGDFCGVRACDDGLFCQYDHPASPRCEVERGDGEACFEDIDEAHVFFRCEQGLACADDELCHPEGEEGDECGAARRCAAALACVDGACTRPLVGRAVGDPCDAAGAGCGSTLDTGLACVEGACVQAGVVEAGEECDEGGAGDDDKGTARWCRYGLTTHYCHVPFGESTGICDERPRLGDDCRAAPCDTTLGGCVIEDGGRNAFCRPWPDPGERCLVEGALPTCGPELSCQREGSSDACALSPFPTAIPSCG